MSWVLWALVGWCGTPWRRPWWPPPPPGPDPWYSKFASVVGGIAGGWVYNLTWAMGANVTGVDVAATAVGAFVGGVVLGDLVSIAFGGRKA
jgi:hypothetical protein